jgi:hypothetical protein
MARVFRDDDEKRFIPEGLLRKAKAGMPILVIETSL